MEDLPHDPTAGHTGFERELPDNSVEYLLFVIEDDTPESKDTLMQLEKLRRSALDLCQNIAKDYIWQRDEFKLELKNEGGLAYLHGLTEYGDAVEDEWLIVYILRTLTSSHPNLWLRVFDTDGEFLLVEAANVLPKWLSPEIDHNRVWIHDGKLFLIPCKDDDTSRSLSLKYAVEFIKTERSDVVHSSFIEAEAFYRLEKYPVQIKDSIHHSLITIPRRLASILHALPKSIAPAMEAFYLRDALALQPILSQSSTLTFPPQDLVTVSVRFSKVLYAQLRSQRFETPQRWQPALPKSFPSDPEARGNDEETRRLEAGMKLTCGFEMLAAKAEASKSRTVRELAILIDDMKDDGDEALPTDAEIKSRPDSGRNDSESWLDINYEDFERELSGKQNPTKSTTTKERFGDAQAQDNLRKIVSRFEAFLNDETAGLGGADMDEMDFDDDDNDDLDSEEEDSEDEDKEVSFDEEEFARLMKEMMGLPSDVRPSNTNPQITNNTATTAAAAAAQANDDDDDDDDDDEVEEIQRLTSQFEAELNHHGALELDPLRKKQSQLEKDANDAESRGKEKQKKNSEEEIEEKSDDEVDIDYNLAKNLLESFKSQGGMSGPTGNMLSMMGLNLPRDEDDGKEE